MFAVYAAVLLGSLYVLWKSRRNYEALPELAAGEPCTSADVTVIIPARNEAGQIGRCLKSFSGTVIVVDDASDDDTAEIARTAGALVISAPGLRPGDLGKPNACAAGARAASTRWLLFVDADTWFVPEFVESAIAYAERESLDVLTAFLEQKRETWAERVILPYAFALYFCGVNARNIQDPQSPEALANGQCLLVRRSAYEFIGGHDAVKRSVIEDVQLARLAKRHRLRMRVVRAERLGAVRMYDGFGAIWRGLEKNSFRFLQANPWTGAQVIGASILLMSCIPVAAAAAHDGRLAFAILSLAAPLILLRAWYGSAREALTAHVAIYLFQLIALAGMWKALSGGKTTWKGRRV